VSITPAAKRKIACSASIRAVGGPAGLLFPHPCPDPGRTNEVKPHGVLACTMQEGWVTLPSGDQTFNDSVTKSKVRQPLRCANPGGCDQARHRCDRWRARCRCVIGYGDVGKGSASRCRGWLPR